jgi:hypothetical protein
MERSLVEIVGKAKVLGAPFLYGTTQDFLEYLGLNSLKDLPSMEDLEALLAKEASAEMAIEGEAPPETEARGGDALVERIVAEVDIDEDERLDNLDGRTMPAARSAVLGPHIDEPMNRPVTRGSVDVADESEDAEPAETNDESDDDIHP